LLDDFKKGKTKDELVSKVRKQVLGLGTYFNKIVGVAEDDDTEKLDFVLVDVDLTRYFKNFGRNRADHIKNKF